MAQKKLQKIELSIVADLKKAFDNVRLTSGDMQEMDIDYRLLMIVQYLAPTWSYLKATVNAKKRIDDDYNKIVNGLKEFGFAIPDDFKKNYEKINSAISQEIDFVRGSLKRIIAEQEV